MSFRFGFHHAKTMEILVNDDITQEIKSLAESWHEIYEASKGVQCNFRKFQILAKENDEIIGILIGYTAFSDVYVDELVVHEKFRRQGIGRKLLQHLEKYFDGKNYTNISLVTNEFQAPEFYKKNGYKIISELNNIPIGYKKYHLIKEL